jgi:hypothetical protein
LFTSDLENHDFGVGANHDALTNFAREHQHSLRPSVELSRLAEPIRRE